ncbi:hypothetical protein [Siphonobacter sp. SORGH_AS_1065]|uniref:HD domain-containing protein n=1 Tax=Siphonobacter sp. SORGH_AS_1065 TaxID=3041795 RepID=UPI0027872FE2|nr:hypothetical protein [Siphonobacter sp. SORGH_AS_1065]MDQ1089527.1 putative metal-dependent HD superfamily phosphohydrolase [Siphonobacter sp. SORGH_AS_1065]
MEELKALLQSVSDLSYAEKVMAFLDQYYSNTDVRPYHNWTHIQHMFDLFSTHREHLHQPDIVLLSIAFHDVIYEPLYTNNELQSAERAQEWLSKTDLSTESIRTIYEYILSTKTHANHTEDSDLDFLLDLDLAILGESPEIYDAYAQKIRTEFQAIPEAIYADGRKKILNVFLAMANIYKTHLFQDQYETQARANIRREIERLN